MNGVISLIVAFGGLGLLVTALVTFFVALRRTAGTVKHSEAEVIWNQTQALIEDLQKRNEFLRTKYDECSAKILEVERRVLHLEEENRMLHLKNGELKRRVVELEDEVRRLTAELKRKDAENIILRNRVKELEEHNEES